MIPTVSWGKPESFWYCFEGVEEGSVVAVSTLGVKKEKDFFLQGYNEMLRRIKPEAVICYSSPFEEMEGNVVPVDYAETNNLKSFYITKTTTQSSSNLEITNNNLYNKTVYGYIVTTGMGSGVGGKIPKYPGNDPSKSPGKDFEWRGRGGPEDGKGNWYNPKTGESFHPDLNHPGPIKPHWDYNYPGGPKNGYRIFPDGSYEIKEFEMEDIYYG